METPAALQPGSPEGQHRGVEAHGQAAAPGSGLRAGGAAEEEERLSPTELKRWELLGCRNSHGHRATAWDKQVPASALRQSPPAERGALGGTPHRGKRLPGLCP